MRIEEKQFINYIRQKEIKNMVIVDVGSNIGNYIDYIQNEVPTIKKCYSFEPIKSCYDKIKTKKNRVIYNIGLGSKKEKKIFYECVGSETHSSFVNREWLYKKPEYNIYKKEIFIDILDNFIDEKVDILKIDTEGFELEVLKGSIRQLKNKTIDYIQFEYGGCFKDNGVRLNDVINFLKEYGYKVNSLMDNKFQNITNYEDDYKWINFYATHKEL